MQRRINKMTTQDILIKAKETVRLLRGISDEKINEALLKMADALVLSTEKILTENKKDIDLAKDKISSVMIDRLTLTEARISAMADGIREITNLPSPLGKTLRKTVRPNGLVIEKVSVPMGVIAIIYESRPNVTSDAAALALKSGNVCILRGGKEAYNSARAIVDALEEGLTLAGLPKSAAQLVSDTTRESANELMKAKGYIDLLIPRGGKGLISACVENATVPCLETGTGICHIYVDKDAELNKALSIIENAKTSRPSVCNAAEVCLVHKDIAKKFLPMLKAKLTDERKTNPVELRCDDAALKIIDASPLGNDGFDTEFLDYILAVGIVDSVEAAVSHILEHSTQHSEAIITENKEAADYFTMNTDSAATYVNASTRFTDGGEFGLGCEMGISTQKMHARGPLGIEELTTYKYIIHGNGHIR
jgi:glutamate-5-semialdehyde dehydrogenase